MSTAPQTPASENLRTEIEIGANTVALVKLPMPVKDLAGMIQHLEKAHGKELRMAEDPKGWLKFFKP